MTRSMLCLGLAAGLVLAAGCGPGGGLDAGPPMDPNFELLKNADLSLSTGGRNEGGGADWWYVFDGIGAVTLRQGEVAIETDMPADASVGAQAQRGAIHAGQAYRLAIRYTLASGGADVKLRFRNRVDRDSPEFAVPDAASDANLVVFALAPEDYEAGMYFLEVRIRGRGAKMTIHGASVRAATPDEIASHKLHPTQPAGNGFWATEPGESSDPNQARLTELRGLAVMDASARRRAWERPFDADSHLHRLKREGGSLLLEVNPARLAVGVLKSYAAAQPPRGALSLTVGRRETQVPGGYGLDPLPPRSVHGAALLIGVGAVDTGIGSWQHKQLVKLLDSFGYFDPNTEFIPFWEPNSPVRHTAPGVLTSVYVNRQAGRALIVLCNCSNQPRGKMGDILVDHKRLLGRPWDYRRDKASAPEDGTNITADWNRKDRSGTIRDVWGDIAVPTGDYKLILLQEAK